MVWLVLAVVVVAIALSLFNVLSAVGALAFAIAGLMVVAGFGEWRDRARQRSRWHDPSRFFDANKPNEYGTTADPTGWTPPTAYIDHPTGTGPPPGVDRHDERPPRR